MTSKAVFPKRPGFQLHTAWKVFQNPYLRRLNFYRRYHFGENRRKARPPTDRPLEFRRKAPLSSVTTAITDHNLLRQEFSMYSAMITVSKLLHRSVKKQLQTTTTTTASKQQQQQQTAG